MGVLTFDFGRTEMEFNVSPAMIGMVISFVACAILVGVVAGATQKIIVPDDEAKSDVFNPGWIACAVGAVVMAVPIFVSWCFFLQKIVSPCL